MSEKNTFSAKHSNEASRPEGNPDNYVPQLDARHKIVEILTKIETRQAFTDKLLERSIDDFNDRDRGLITEVVNGVLRWQYRLDWYLSQLYIGEFADLIPDVKNNLRASLYQLLSLDRVPDYAVLNEAVEIAKNKFNQKTANLVNAILRNFLRQQKKLEYMEMQLDILERMAVRYSHPSWLLQRWIEYWGVDEALKLCECNNCRPRVTARINHLLADEEVFFKILSEHQVEYQRHPDFENFIWISDFSEFRKLDFLKRGWVSIQDMSTAIPVRLLNPQPGESVLDMCAAPGGKSSLIAEKMQNSGLLLAMDRHYNRAKALNDNLRRLGVSIARVVAADALKPIVNHSFDRILVDAPCTGFGVLSKRVDLKWKRTEDDIRNMRRVQIQMLDSASRLLKPDGKIVYSTCTIEPEENEKVVEEFIETHSDFRLDRITGELPDKYIVNQSYVRTFPHKHKIDGSFCARFHKIRR